MKFIIVLLIALNSSILAKEKITLEGKLNQEYFLKKKDVNSPAGVFVKLFSWKSKKGEHCIVYKTPIKERRGSLYLIDTIDCQLSKGKRNKFKDNISRLSIKKNENNILLTFDDNEMAFSFPYSSQFKYIKLTNDLTNDIEVGKLCRKFSNSCLDKVIDDCDRCMGNMWTPELNWRCSQGSERRCGNFNCGHKNESACLKFLPQARSISCFDASKYTYCKKGLTHFCEGDGRIICK